MKNKFKEAFLSNIPLKIIALISAAILWILIVNVDDPVKSKTFTAKVTVLNENVLTANNQYYEVASENQTVSFRVSGKRSIIEKLSNSDFTATADLNFLTSSNEVPIDIEPTRYTSLITMPTRAYYLPVEIGNLQTKRFAIKAEAKGKPADGVVINAVTATPNVLTVEGPEKIVSSIDTVAAEIDVTGISTDIDEAVVPKFYGAKGKEINTSRLEIGVSTVEVNVDVAFSKDVDIVIETSGELKDGMKLEKVTTNPSSIAVQGEADILNNLSSIVIPNTVIDLDSVTQDMETAVDITRYLPEGVKLVDSSENTVTVIVKVATATTKNFAIPTANLTVEGLKGMEARFLSDKITVEINGFPEDVDKLVADEITGSVDASGLTEGEHKVDVTLKLPDGLTINGGVLSTDIMVTKKTE